MLLGLFSSVFAPPKIKDAKRILCVQPHPDDNEIGMGGTIAEYAARGCEIIYLTVTNGDFGSPSPDIGKKEIAEIRRAETEAAGRCLGAVGFRRLEKPDCSLFDIPSLAAEIARIIKQVKPDVVFCPDPWVAYEVHGDHIATGRAAAQAFMLSSLPNYPDEGGEKHEARAIAFYYTDRPNSFINITRSFNKKFEAVALHKSQITDELISAYRKYFKLKGIQYGLFRFFGLAEGFRVLSPLHLHCFPDAKRI